MCVLSIQLLSLSMFNCVYSDACKPTENVEAGKNNDYNPETTNKKSPRQIYSVKETSI